jgi:hypothetical protein
MRTLIVLSVLQTAAIAALVVHAFGAGHPTHIEQRASGSSAPTAPSSTTTGPSFNVSEERLRAIVREELARLLQSSLPGNASAVEAPPRNLSPDAQRAEAVAQQIEAYRGAGSMTDAQMQELQTSIAQLDEAGRKQMMSKLMRALNSGEIKGRL